MDINLLDLEISADSKLYHKNFRSNWRRSLERNSSREATEEWIQPENQQKIYLCDSLKEILKKTDLHPDDQKKNREVFEEYLEAGGFVALEPRRLSTPFTWYNRTTNGINLRPGELEGSIRLPEPIRMCGQNSHGIIAGRTGSGKSVFLNNLILNMMIEYAPWELELYLADFKKVELSRYMNRYPSPHVRACAATSEVDYVQSLIQFIKEKKDDREKLFARLGYLNIEEFRLAYHKDNYEVVMPRILFVVDEFQQLFLDADTFQKSVIDDLITDITRKGRSQGVHLLFASQDMAGALNQKQLSNFKVRFALACEAGISSDVLGNNGATQLKVGQVIANTKSKEKIDNDIYSVPIAEDSDNSMEGNGEEYFFRLLKEFENYAEEQGYKYRGTQKFYDEDQQFDIEKLDALLENPKIKAIRTFEQVPHADGASGQAVSKQQNFMSLILGRKIVYSSKEYDIENFFIDYAKNRCLLCISGNSSDLAYFQKLVAMNLRTMDVSREDDNLNAVNRRFAVPYFYDLNPLVSSIYPGTERIKDFDCTEKTLEEYVGAESVEGRKKILKEFADRWIYYRAEELDRLYGLFYFRKLIAELFRDNRYQNAKEVCYAYMKDYLNKESGIKDSSVQKELLEKVEKAGFHVLKEDDSNILEFTKNLDFLGVFQNDIRELLELYYRYKIRKIQPIYKLFRPTVVWITGIENLERLPQWFEEYASDGLNYNILTMFFSTAAVNYAVKQACNYIFVAGSNPKLYDDYLGKKPPKGNNDLKIRCLIKNTNQAFGFKKYRCKLAEPSIRSIDFDAEL